MYVVPFVLSCAIVCALAVIGYGIVDWLGRAFPATRRWLLMPFAGLSLLTIAAIFLNRLGLPAKSFTAPLVIVLLVLNIAYMAFVSRPRIAWRVAPVWAVGLLAAVLLVGWPLLVAGTNWVSLGNGDMTAYALGGQHFYEHGFYQIPPLAELNRELDRSWDLSFQYSLGQVRYASQLVLACVMAVIGLDGGRSFMILIVALHVVMLTTTAALVCRRTSQTSIALVVLLVVAVSANLAYGTFAQLLPQDFGLAALAAAALVVLDLPADRRALTAQAVLGGLFCATLLVAYPELSPFLALSFAIFAAVSLLRRTWKWRRAAVFFGIIAALTIVFANVSLVGVGRELIIAEGHGAGNAAVNELFPYYLTPLGFAVAWGFMPYGSGDVSSLKAQIFAFAGAFLYVVGMVLAVRLSWRLEAVGIVATTMLILVFYLFARQNGFGLFKLAMYAQPFVLPVFVAAVARVLSPGPAPARSTASP